MRCYVSWKTTDYYRKDSLKLAECCPVSGCWLSCIKLKKAAAVCFQKRQTHISGTVRDRPINQVWFADEPCLSKPCWCTCGEIQYAYSHHLQRSVNSHISKHGI